MNRHLNYTLIAVGSRGDVQPFIALGLGLQAAKQNVRLVALEPFGDLVRAYGLEFISLGELPRRFTRQSPIRLNFSGITGRILFWLFCRRLISGYLEKFVEVCKGAEVLIYSRLAFPVYHVAEKMQVPCFYASPVPHTPTTTFVDPLFANSWLAAHPRTRRFSFKLEEQLTLQCTAAAINRWRQDTLRLKPVKRHRLASHRAAWTKGTMYAFSRLVLKRPAEWQSNVEATGFWFLDHPPHWKPDPALENFLATGAPPVFIGFGSMQVRNRESLTQLFIEALATSGLRGIFLLDELGFQGIKPGSPDFYFVQEIPQDWLFPRVCAVIHHGGAGTTAAALRAGIPSLAIPINYDQPFWGKLIATIGAGLAPMPVHSLTPLKLAHATHRLATDGDIRNKALEMKARLAKEDGVKQAIQFIKAITEGKLCNSKAEH